MNLRLEALEKGLLKYSSGKPCRRGHTSDRYASNGMCIMCQNGDADTKRALVVENRAKRTLAIYSQHLPHQVLCKMADRELMDEFAAILQHSTPETAIEMKKYIHALYLASPTPRALNKEFLASKIDYRDGIIRNPHDLELNHMESVDEDEHFIFNGLHYNARHCLDVLLGKRPNVKPKLSKIS